METKHKVLEQVNGDVIVVEIIGDYRLNRRCSYVPTTHTIRYSPDYEYKEIGIAHELGHAKLAHIVSRLNRPLITFNEEIDAWRVGLKNQRPTVNEMLEILDCLVSYYNLFELGYRELILLEDFIRELQ